MNPVRVVQGSVKILKLYDGSVTSPESHFETFKTEDPACVAGIEQLLWEIFEGCIAYRNILKVVVDGFYAQVGASYLKSDRALFEMMCYFAVFGAQHVEWSGLEKFVKVFDPAKARRFYSFFLDPQNIDGWIRDQWKLLYEEDFVRRNFLAPVQANGPPILGALEKADKQSAALAPEPTTVPKPFSLTAPKLKTLPMPSSLPPAAPKFTAVPATTYATPLELQAH